MPENKTKTFVIECHYIYFKAEMHHFSVSIATLQLALYICDQFGSLETCKSSLFV